MCYGPDYKVSIQTLQYIASWKEYYCHKIYKILEILKGFQPSSIKSLYAAVAVPSTRLLRKRRKILKGFRTQRICPPKGKSAVAYFHIKYEL